MQAASSPQVKDHFGSIDAPNPADLAIHLEELVQQGSLSPEQAQTILQEKSAMGGITLDPKLKSAQMEALASLQEIGDSGLTATDKADFARIQSDEQARERGAREAILQNAEARGMGGSGLEIMSQLKNQQDSASRTAERDLDVAALAKQRALEALIQGGSMAGNIRNQDFNEQAQVAQAEDAISRFNTQNRQNQVNLNTAARNDASAKNLGVKQAIADTNTGMRNQQQIQNKNLIQQNFDNELKKRGGKQQVAQTNAQIQGQNAQNQADANNKNIGTALTIGAMFASDERGKENVEELDPSAFLDEITGYKFNYKDPKNGSGKQAGVMAQDLQKSAVGNTMVEETPSGLMVDSTKATGPMLAALASLNERLKKVEGGM